MTEVTHSRTSHHVAMRVERTPGIFRRSYFSGYQEALSVGKAWLLEEGKHDEDNCHFISVRISDEGDILGSEDLGRITYKEVKEEEDE